MRTTFCDGSHKGTEFTPPLKVFGQPHLYEAGWSGGVRVGELEINTEAAKETAGRTGNK